MTLLRHKWRNICKYTTTYSYYEIGNLNVPVDVLIKLAKFYNTSIDYLVELTDDPERYK